MSLDPPSGFPIICLFTQQEQKPQASVILCSNPYLEITGLWGFFSGIFILMINNKYINWYCPPVMDHDQQDCVQIKKIMLFAISSKAYESANP